MELSYLMSLNCITSVDLILSWIEGTGSLDCSELSSVLLWGPCWNLCLTNAHLWVFFNSLAVITCILYLNLKGKVTEDIFSVLFCRASIFFFSNFIVGLCIFLMEVRKFRARIATLETLTCYSFTIHSHLHVHCINKCVPLSKFYIRYLKLGCKTMICRLVLVLSLFTHY